MSSVVSKEQTATLPSTAFAAPWAKRSLFIGILGLALGLIALFIDPSTRSFHGWMIGLVFWVAIAIGNLMLLFMHYLFGAGWSVVVRRQYEHVVGALPWLALGAIPLLLASYILPHDQSGTVWTWMNPDAAIASSPFHEGIATVGHDPLYIKKSAFLNKGFFLARTVFYFAVFAFFATRLRKFSFKMDEDGQPRWVHLSRKYAAAGVIIVALSQGFLAYDWIMSINYHWFSTMFPVWFFSVCMKSGLSVAILIFAHQYSKGHLKGYGNDSHLYLMGSMLLAFVMFWAYVTFSQYFLIYSANIPEETFWYRIREDYGWWSVGMIIVFAGFFTPFFALLSNKVKIVPKLLSAVALLILATTLIELYYNIIPQQIYAENELGYIVPHFSLGLTEVGAFIGFGGILFWAFFRSLARQKAVPIKDPFILDSIHFHR